MNKSPRSRSIPVRTIPSNAIKHREREIERLLTQTHSKETSLGVWRQNGTTKAFRGNLKVYEGIRDHEHSLWRANKQGASSAIALCCRLELSLTVCVYVCMQGPPTPPGATPPLFTSASAPFHRSTLPYCKFYGSCIKLWSCPGIDPTLPSGYAARAHIRYVHF